MMRGIVGLLLVCAASAASAQSPYKDLKVRSCPVADSLLGAGGDDDKGDVRGFYYKERDSTYLLVAPERGRVRLSAHVKFKGQRPAQNPAMQLDVWLRGAPAEAVKDIPAVTLVLDDSVNVLLEDVRLGTYIGPERPANVEPVLPVSALLEPDVAVRTLRARKISVRVDTFDVPLTSSDRRNLRALLRIAVCP